MLLSQVHWYSNTECANPKCIGAFAPWQRYKSEALTYKDALLLSVQ